MLAPPCQPSKYFCHEFLSSGTANKEAVNSQMPSPMAEGIVKSQSAGVISVCSDFIYVGPTFAAFGFLSQFSF